VALLADVVVLGGGPAGVSCAAAMARRGLSVHLLDRGRRRGSRPAETLSPSAVRSLSRLQLTSASKEVARRPCRGIVYRWDSEQEDFADHALVGCGPGALIERELLDAALQWDARAHGVEVWSNSGVARCQVSDDGIALRMAATAGLDPVELRARFGVDASGRAGGFPAAELRPARRYCDKLLAIAFEVQGETVADVLQIAAAPDGWWYSASRRTAEASAVFLTDADCLPSGHDARTRFLSAQWRAAFGTEEPPEIQGEPGAVLDARTSVRSAFSRSRWLAVGDAAFTLDPLSGNGVERALRFADAIADAVESRIKGRGLAQLRGMAEAQQRAFAEARVAGRRAYAGAAARFRERPFWQRRVGHD